MKRNMELIKAILLKIEDETFDDTIDTYSEKEVYNHIKLLIDANLVEGKYYISTESSKPEVSAIIVNGITWQGYNFLDILKDENKFRVIKDLAKNLSIEALKSAINHAIQGA